LREACRASRSWGVRALYRRRGYISRGEVNHSRRYNGDMSEHRDKTKRFAMRALAGLAMVFVGFYGFALQGAGHGPDSLMDLVFRVTVSVLCFGLMGAGFAYPFGKQRLGFWIGILEAAILGAAASSWI
jgi:hypothetical protein